MKPRKTIMKPSKNDKFKNKKRAECTTNNFTLTQGQQSYYNSQLQFDGLSFADAIFKITAYEDFSEVNIDPLFREICRTYASVIGRYKFKYLVSFYALFEQIFTDEHQPHQTLTFNDAHIKLRRKQLTSPDCINNKFVTWFFRRSGRDTVIQEPKHGYQTF